MSLKNSSFLCSVCYCCKQKTQLTVAAVLSTVYAALMVVVMVGIIKTFVSSNILDPSLFFIQVVSGKLSVQMCTSCGIHIWEFCCETTNQQQTIFNSASEQLIMILNKDFK